MRSKAWKNQGGAMFAMASLLGLLAVPGMAQTQTPAQAPAASEERRIDTTVLGLPPDEAPVQAEEGAIRLSLDEAIEIGLRRNLGLVIQRYNRVQSRLAITESLGIYDLVSAARGVANDENNATFSTIEASQSNDQTLGFSLTQRLPTGGGVSFGYSASRQESNSPVFGDITTFYTSGTTFSFTQPLLRNFGRLFNERNILVARNNSRISQEEFERQVTLTIQQIVNAYWDLVEAREQLGVARESLALAQELHERNRIQVDVGTLPPLELVQSEATIASRDEEIIRATATVGDAADQLRRLLNLPSGALWEAPIEPTTEPQIQSMQIDVNQAIQTAYAERPELRIQELNVEQNRINAAVALNQVRPALDLELDYGYSGVGTQYSSALEQITGLDFRGLTAQLIFSYPIENRAARAASASANLEVEQALAEVEDLRTVISTEVRQAARAVETAARQIEASRISREFQEKNLEAERKRYENGMSTSFQITQIQEDVTLARSREVSARLTYLRALAELNRATGRLLEVEGVAINEVPTPEGPVDWWSFDRTLLPGEER